MPSETLATTQYKDSTNLKKRASLHSKLGKGDWFGFVVNAGTFVAGSRVLDIGCGPGWLWKAARPVVPADLKITLADQSQGMVAEAQELVTRLGWFDTNVVVADVCQLPFPDDSFDMVVALHMLYHASDPTKGVAEIARVLRPGGQALISANGRANMVELDNLGREAFGSSAVDQLIAAFSIETGEPIVRARFKSVELRRDINKFTITASEDICSYLTSFPPGNSAPAQQIASLEALARETLASGAGRLEVHTDVGLFVCAN